MYIGLCISSKDAHSTRRHFWSRLILLCLYYTEIKIVTFRRPSETGITCAK